MSNKLLNYFEQHAAISKIRFNRSMTLHQVFTEMMAIGTRSHIAEHVIEAALLYPAFSQKRVNLRLIELQQSSIAELQALSSPAAVRLAVLYSSIRNPNTDLWDGTAKIDGVALQELRTIDTLYALASNLPTNEHHDHAIRNNIVFKSTEYQLRKLDDEYNGAMKGWIGHSGILVKMVDSHILVYLGTLAIASPNQVYQFHAFNSAQENTTFYLDVELARELLLAFQTNLIALQNAYSTERANILAGKATPNFELPSLIV